MNKENLLFGIIGLLAGLIIGFMFANTLNQRAMTTQPSQMAGPIDPNAQVPPGHPSIPPTGPGEITPEIQGFIDAAKNSASDFNAQVKAAENLYQLRRYETAFEYFSKANEIKPDDYNVIVQLGNVTFDAGRFEDAEKWYLRALEKKKDDVNVRTDLGLTFMFREKKDNERAIREFKQSLETDPFHKPTLQNLTVAYTRVGDAKNARETLTRLEKLDPSNASLQNLKNEIQKIESGAPNASNSGG